MQLQSSNKISNKKLHFPKKACKYVLNPKYASTNVAKTLKSVHILNQKKTAINLGFFKLKQV